MKVIFKVLFTCAFVVVSNFVYAAEKTDSPSKEIKNVNNDFERMPITDFPDIIKVLENIDSITYARSWAIKCGFPNDDARWKETYSLYVPAGKIIDALIAEKMETKKSSAPFANPIDIILHCRNAFGIGKDVGVWVDGDDLLQNAE